MRTVAAVLIGLGIASAGLAADAEQGKALYEKLNCKMCHAADGSASTPAGKKFQARDLRSAEVQSQSDEVLAGIIRAGKGKMPAWKDKINDAGIADLVAYVRRLGSAK
jgi:mono/diheme cytochrome c family protein